MVTTLKKAAVIKMLSAHIGVVINTKDEGHEVIRFLRRHPRAAAPSPQIDGVWWPTMGGRAYLSRIGYLTYVCDNGWHTQKGSSG